MPNVTKCEKCGADVLKVTAASRSFDSLVHLDAGGTLGFVLGDDNTCYPKSVHRLHNCPPAPGSLMAIAQELREKT